MIQRAARCYRTSVHLNLAEQERNTDGPNDGSQRGQWDKPSKLMEGLCAERSTHTFMLRCTSCTCRVWVCVRVHRRRRVGRNTKEASPREAVYSRSSSSPCSVVG